MNADAETDETWQLKHLLDGFIRIYSIPIYFNWKRKPLYTSTSPNFIMSILKTKGCLGSSLSNVSVAFCPEIYPDSKGIALYSLKTNVIIYMQYEKFKISGGQLLQVTDFYTSI